MCIFLQKFSFNFHFPFSNTNIFFILSLSLYIFSFYRSNESFTGRTSELDSENKTESTEIDTIINGNTEMVIDTETETETESETDQESKSPSLSPTNTSYSPSKRLSNQFENETESQGNGTVNGTPLTHPTKGEPHEPPEKKPKRTNHTNGAAKRKKPKRGSDSSEFEYDSTNSSGSSSEPEYSTGDGAVPIDDEENNTISDSNSNNRAGMNASGDESESESENESRGYVITLRQDPSALGPNKKFKVYFKTQVQALIRKQFPVTFSGDIEKFLHRRTFVCGTGPSRKVVEREYLIKWVFMSYRNCCWVPSKIIDNVYNLSAERRRFDKRFDKLLAEGKTTEYTKCIAVDGDGTDDVSAITSGVCDKEQRVDPLDWSLEDGIVFETLEPTDILMSLEPTDESTLSLVDEDNRQWVKERIFLVKWRDMSVCDATWETAASLGNDELIRRYDAIRDTFSLDVSVGKKVESQPAFMSESNLLPHQVSGSRFILSACLSSTHGAIVADEKGLKKTVQTVIALKRIKKAYSSPFLVVTPSSSVAHWENVIRTWSDLVCVVYNGSPEERNITKCKLFPIHYSYSHF